MVTLYQYLLESFLFKQNACWWIDNNFCQLSSLNIVYSVLPFSYSPNCCVSYTILHDITRCYTISHDITRYRTMPFLTSRSRKFYTHQSVVSLTRYYTISHDTTRDYTILHDVARCYFSLLALESFIGQSNLAAFNRCMNRLAFPLCWSFLLPVLVSFCAK